VAELIYQLPAPFQSPDGVSYVVQAWAELDGAWHGWLVFIAADGSILRTGRLTSYANRDRLRRWAVRLRRRALTTALERAVPPTSEHPAA